MKLAVLIDDNGKANPFAAFFTNTAILLKLLSYGYVSKPMPDMVKRGKKLVLKSSFQWDIRRLTDFDISLPGFLPKFEVTQTVAFLNSVSGA